MKKSKYWYLIKHFLNLFNQYFFLAKQNKTKKGMWCIFCNVHLFVISLWYRKYNKFPFSYICICTNKNCKEYLVKFRRKTKKLPTLY